MSGFAPGDVVVCVDARPYRTNPRLRGREWPFRQGSVWRVEAVSRSPMGFFGIELVGAPRSITGFGYAIKRFRKIDPASDEFTEQMRALRPHTERVPA